MTQNDAKSASLSARALFGLRLAALVVILLGGVILTQVPHIGTGAGFIVVGPRVFPTVIGIGVLLLGILFLLRTTFQPDRDLIAEVEAEETSTDWATIILTFLSLVVYAALLKPLGYALATGLFFPAVARIFGSTRLGRDVIIGVILGLVIYLSFTQILGVRLPAGLLAGIL